MQLNVVVVVCNSFIYVQISDKSYQLLWKDSDERSYLLSLSVTDELYIFLGEFHCQVLVIDFAPNGDRFTCPSQNVCPVSLPFPEWSLARLSNTINSMFR